MDTSCHDPQRADGRFPRLHLIQQQGGLQQLLGVEDQLAQQEGVGENNAQDVLQELQLQKTVLGHTIPDHELEAFMRRTNLWTPGERVVNGKLAREVPIKDGYTFGRTALELAGLLRRLARNLGRLRNVGLQVGKT